MLSVRFILILNILVIKYTLCAILKNMNSKRHSLRIVGGRDAMPGEYPYVLGIEAKILRKNGSTVHTHICTDACIKPNWSMTAAHCMFVMEYFNKLEDTNLVLRYNPSDKKVAFVKVISMVMHPNYDTSDSFTHNDIGILKNEEIYLSSYARVSPVDFSTLYGVEISAVGFGLMLDDYGGFNSALSLNKPLQVVNAMIIKCRTIMSPNYCLAGICGKWIPLSPGDSGGPVIHYSGIVGVNTGSDFQNIRKIGVFPSSKKSYIGIITPVSPFIDWIVNVINIK